MCRVVSLRCVVVALLLRRRCLRRSMSRFTQEILPATHLIANSGDDTARSTICVMRSRRQNRRLEKTAILIVATRSAGGGALKMGADGNGDRRQSLVRLFFLSFFALQFLRFPPEEKKRGGGDPPDPLPLQLRFVFASSCTSNLSNK